MSVHSLLHLMFVLFLDSFLCYHFTHICKIWDNIIMRFHKQSLEISWLWPQRKQPEEYLVILLVVKRKLIERYSCLEFILINNENVLKLNIALLYLQGFYSWFRIFRDTSLSILVFTNKSCMSFKKFHWIIHLSWLFIKISFLLLCWLFSVVHEHHMQYFRSKIKTKIILRTLTARCVWVFEYSVNTFFIIVKRVSISQVLFIQAFNSSHCTWHLFWRQKSEVTGWKDDFGNWITKIFFKVSAQSLLLPCILHRSRLTWLNSPL